MVVRRLLLIVGLALLSTVKPLANAADDTASATVIVKVPADAKVYIDGRLTSKTGNSRTLSTPAFQRGKSYDYEVKVEVILDGKLVTKTKVISLRAGSTTEVDFGDMRSATDPSPRTLPKISDVPPATHLRLPKITPIEDPMLPDLLPDSKMK